MISVAPNWCGLQLFPFCSQLAQPTTSRTLMSLVIHVVAPCVLDAVALLILESTPPIFSDSRVPFFNLLWWLSFRVGSSLNCLMILVCMWVWGAKTLIKRNECLEHRLGGSMIGRESVISLGTFLVSLTVIIYRSLLLSSFPREESSSLFLPWRASLLSVFLQLSRRIRPSGAF